MAGDRQQPNASERPPPRSPPNGSRGIGLANWTTQRPLNLGNRSIPLRRSGRRWRYGSLPLLPKARSHRHDRTASEPHLCSRRVSLRLRPDARPTWSGRTWKWRKSSGEVGPQTDPHPPRPRANDDDAAGNGAVGGAARAQRGTGTASSTPRSQPRGHWGQRGDQAKEGGDATRRWGRRPIDQICNLRPTTG